MFSSILKYVLQNHHALLGCVVCSAVTGASSAIGTSITNFVLTKATNTLMRCIKKLRQHFKDQH